MSAEKMQIFNVYRWMTDLSFKPVVIAPRSKGAMDNEYGSLSYVPPPMEKWVGQDLNIGVVCGPKHRGPLDVDLDCDEAVRLAPFFLPHTDAIFGRKSKPRSHYLYRSKDPEFPKRSYIDPIEKKTILEIRGDGGHCTVMPGSTHETGEEVKWYKWAQKATTNDPTPIGGNVAEVESQVILRHCGMLASSVLIARHMWQEGQRNSVSLPLAGFFYYAGYTQQEAEHVFRMVMELTADDDETRIKNLANTYRKAEGGTHIAGGPALAKLLGEPIGSQLVQRMRDFLNLRAASSFIEDYNALYCTTIIGGKYRIVAPKDPAKPDGDYDFLSVLDFQHMTADDKLMIDDKLVPKAKVWLEHPSRRKYTNVTFLPGHYDTYPLFNLWRGWGVDVEAPMPESASCDMWLTLLSDVICGEDDDLYRWMLSWFAQIIQQPDQKVGTSPVITGLQGAGKSALVSYFGEIIGKRHHIVVSLADHLTSRFNSAIAEALVVHSEEATFVGDPRHRSYFKSLITDEWQIMERKGIDAVPIRSFSRLIRTTNDPNAVHAEHSDRRHTVIDMKERKMPDSMKADFFRERATLGPRALYHFLKSYQFDDRLIKVNHKNEALATQKLGSLSLYERHLYNMLYEGKVLSAGRRWQSELSTEYKDNPGYSEDWPNVVSTTAVYEDLADLSRLDRERANQDRMRFWPLIEKILRVKFYKKQKWFINRGDTSDMPSNEPLETRSVAVFNWPPLDKARMAFEVYLEQPIVWPEDTKAPFERHDSF